MGVEGRSASLQACQACSQNHRALCSAALCTWRSSAPTCSQRTWVASPMRPAPASRSLMNREDILPFLMMSEASR